jgi:hypothetical protein
MVFLLCKNYFDMVFERSQFFLTASLRREQKGVLEKKHSRPGALHHTKAGASIPIQKLYLI